MTATLLPPSGDAVIAGDPPAGRRFGRVVLAAPIVVALLLRVALLMRPGYLFGITEYDDGAYVGETLRWLGGAMPYRDFPVVHPPAILYLLAPLAALAHPLGSDGVLAAARVLTVVVDVACVAVAGRLLRHRGRKAQLTVMTTLAVSPVALTTAHTLLLEPYLNLCCLLALLVLLPGGRLGGRWRVIASGLLFGVAAAIKIFAIFPAAAVVIVLVWRHRRRVAAFVTAAIAAFVALAAPLAASAPTAFVHEVIIDQLFRTTAGRTPGYLRLTYLDGVYAFVALPSRGSGFALPLVVMLVPALLLVAAMCAVCWWAFRRRRSAPSDLTAIVGLSAAIACIAMWQVATMYYHYASFAVLFLALLVGLVLPSVLATTTRLRSWRIGIVLLLVVVVAGDVQAVVRTGAAPEPIMLQRLLPSRSCVFSDDPSLTVASSTFATVRGCPAIVDSDGTTLTWSGGVQADKLVGSPAADPVVTRWEDVFSREDYLVLSSGISGSIPMTPELRSFIASQFIDVGPLPSHQGEVYRRRGAASGGAPSARTDR